jgi:uncharacterized LabA/DUF88 family protein
MRTFVYVDGFNLYYRMLEKKPHLKWVDPVALAEQALSRANSIDHVRYYTARVSGRVDPDSPRRQELYLQALRTRPRLSIHMGSFLSSTKFAGLVHPPAFRPELFQQMAEPWPQVVKVHKTEEKGSDVNLACHMLLDGFRGLYDVAAVVSNDSDLIEPIRIVTRELGLKVGLLTPVGNPNPGLRAHATFVRRLSARHVASAQFPDVLKTSEGASIERPKAWR